MMAWTENIESGGSSNALGITKQQTRQVENLIDNWSTEATHEPAMRKELKRGLCEPLTERTRQMKVKRLA